MRLGTERAVLTWALAFLVLSFWEWPFLVVSWLVLFVAAARRSGRAELTPRQARPQRAQE